MSNKKVIITGATGLIGKESIKPLQEAGFDIFALTIDDYRPSWNINWIDCNLFDTGSVKKAFDEVKPQYLLNFAWATTENYLSSNINFDFLKASLDLLKHFKENGGQRAVFAGTCFEYEFKDSHIKETDNLKPETVYAKCKNHLRQLSELYCLQNNISFGWGRIFYAYGIGEYAKRLTALMVHNLKNNQEVIINNGSLLRDYIFSKDIAGAFVKFLDGNTQGAVNICKGQTISLSDFAAIFAKKLDKLQYLKILNKSNNDPLIIAGDNTRLTKEVGYNIQYDYERAADEILQAAI
ncbi:MAG: NAD-dependent epimerase/dehydratase family protein [Elusimicrobiota bacterium]|jgi:nucleoside-diphosphate-sugar epimerase|nr:NAD-dependent epimerase/dehydratase family protein [Elusimicrobiota bacterium]